MKIFKKVILFTLFTASLILDFDLILFSSKICNAQEKHLSGDFGIFGAGGFTITATLEIVSVPFEGITEPKDGYGEPLNRVGKVQNGIYWRYFTPPPNPMLQRNLAYLSGISNIN